jgi:hypothetical protein
LSPYFPPGEGKHALLTDCRYQRFVDWVETAIAYGLSASNKPVPNPKYNPNDTKGTQPATIQEGTWCLDPAQARPGVFDQLKGLPTALCEESPAPTRQPVATKKGRSKDERPKEHQTMAASATENKPPLMFPLTRGNRQILATLELWPRSLISIFIYLGKLVDAEPSDLVTLYNTEAIAHGDRRLTTVLMNTPSIQCFAAYSSYAGDFCVPYQDADNTKRMFGLLAELTALSFTANDIPTSLTVGLTP